MMWEAPSIMYVVDSPAFKDDGAYLRFLGGVHIGTYWPDSTITIFFDGAPPTHATYVIT